MSKKTRLWGILAALVANLLLGYIGTSAPVDPVWRIESHAPPIGAVEVGGVVLGRCQLGHCGDVNVANEQHDVVAWLHDRGSGVRWSLAADDVADMAMYDLTGFTVWHVDPCSQIDC